MECVSGVRVAPGMVASTSTRSMGCRRGCGRVWAVPGTMASARLAGVEGARKKAREEGRVGVCADTPWDAGCGRAGGRVVGCRASARQIGDMAEAEMEVEAEGVDGGEDDAALMALMASDPDLVDDVELFATDLDEINVRIEAFVEQEDWDAAEAETVRLEQLIVKFDRLVNMARMREGLSEGYGVAS